MARFGHLLGKRATGPLPPVAVCLFGLGNPGAEYRTTRHNAGWMLLDRWLESQRKRVKWEKKGLSEVATVSLDAETILLVKPQTYMNDSGKAATWIKRHYGPARFIVIHDEMDLPFGRFKLATTGGAGGHNGLRSLIAELGTKEFDRFKIGIGHRGEEEGVDFVLSGFDREEREAWDGLLDEGTKWLQLYIDKGIAVATQELQRRQRGRGGKPDEAESDA